MKVLFFVLMCVVGLFGEGLSVGIVGDINDRRGEYVTVGDKQFSVLAFYDRKCSVNKGVVSLSTSTGEVCRLIPVENVTSVLNAVLAVKGKEGVVVTSLYKGGTAEIKSGGVRYILTEKTDGIDIVGSSVPRMTRGTSEKSTEGDEYCESCVVDIGSGKSKKPFEDHEKKEKDCNTVTHIIPVRGTNSVKVYKTKHSDEVVVINQYENMRCGPEVGEDGKLSAIYERGVDCLVIDLRGKFIRYGQGAVSIDGVVVTNLVNGGHVNYETRKYKYVMRKGSGKLTATSTKR